MDQRFDDLLHTVIVEKGQGIYGFLDVVFGFLYRKTDFFYEMAPNENMGFFPNQAEALLYNYFRKYREQHYKERVAKRNIDPKEIEEFMKKVKEGKVNPKNKIDNTNNNESNSTNKINKDSITIDQKENLLKDQDGKVDLSKPVDLNNVKKTDSQDTNKLKLETLDNKEVKVNKTLSSQESKQVKNIHNEKYTPISTYNGDSCDNYNWSQASTDVQIQINLPKGVGAKQIKVDISQTKIKVTIKSNNEVYFDGELCEKIKPDDSYWLCEEAGSIILFLTKLTEVIWKSAFKGHKEIDTKTVDNSKRIDEFDNETQAALNKIVYEQNRKKNGLPTSEEEKKLAALKEAWDKPDSPFRGQPFDPKMFNLNEPIYYNTPDYEAKLKWEAAQKESKKNNK